MTIPKILKPHKIPSQDLKAVRSIYERVESREERYELNLYITGYDEQDAVPAVATAGGGESPGAPGIEGSAS
jgi:hypothetical protein